MARRTAFAANSEPSLTVSSAGRSLEFLDIAKAEVWPMSRLLDTDRVAKSRPRIFSIDKSSTASLTDSTPDFDFIVGVDDADGGGVPKVRVQMRK